MGEALNASLRSRHSRTLAQVTAHSSDRVAALAGVHSGTLADTGLPPSVSRNGAHQCRDLSRGPRPGCTLSSGDVLDGRLRSTIRTDARYTEVIG
jgi:hypothetical protein